MTTLDCGHESTCWCGRCHLCEDVAHDTDDSEEGDE